MDPQDRRLIDSYLAGEPEAAERIDGWIRHAASSYRRRLGDRWDDAVAEARLEVYELLSGESFGGRSALKTYLWRVVSHTCLDHIRADVRDPSVSLEEFEGAPAPTPTPSPFGGGRSGAERRTVTRDLLLRVLGEMSDDCRRLWSMVVDGLSYREMSRHTGVSEGALRVRVHRCRERAVALREELLASG